MFFDRSKLKDRGHITQSKELTSYEIERFKTRVSLPKRAMNVPLAPGAVLAVAEDIVSVQVSIWPSNCSNSSALSQFNCHRVYDVDNAR